MRKIILVLLIVIVLSSFCSAKSLQRVCQGNTCVIEFKDFVGPGRSLKWAAVDVYTLGDIGLGFTNSWEERVNIFVDKTYIGTSNAPWDTCSYTTYPSQRVYGSITDLAKDNSLLNGFCDLLSLNLMRSAHLSQP